MSKQVNSKKREANPVADRFEKGLMEVKLHREGKIKLKSARRLLEELSRSSCIY